MLHCYSPIYGICLNIRLVDCRVTVEKVDHLTKCWPSLLYHFCVCKNAKHCSNAYISIIGLFSSMCNYVTATAIGNALFLVVYR